MTPPTWNWRCDERFRWPRLTINYAELPGAQAFRWFPSDLRQAELRAARTLRLHHAARSHANIVAGRVLHDVHHFVGLPDDVMRSLRVVWKSRESHAGAYRQIQSLLGAEISRAQSL